MSGFAYSLDENIGSLRAKASVLSLISNDIEQRFSVNDVSSAGDGFVFYKWDRKPEVLASGEYARLIKVSERLKHEETVILNARLQKIKERLLAEDVFCEEDFDVNIIIARFMYKSAEYNRARDTVMLDYRCFGNMDFLYFKIRHELTDRRLPDTHIIGGQFREYPGLREMFTLITVNIAGFIKLKKSRPKRAKEMLRFCRSVGHHGRGILKCYEKIMRSTSLNDPFDLTEDVFRLVESDEEKAYFPGMREAVRRIAVKRDDNSLDYESTSIRLRLRLKNIYRKYVEIELIRDGLGFKPLTDFSKNIPASLKPFMPYAGYIDYKLDENCVFMRIRLDKSPGADRFAYVYIGLQDNWDLRLGSYGRMYSLSYHKWQSSSPGIFEFEDYDGEKQRGRYWNELIRLPITKLIKRIGSDHAKEAVLFDSLFKELNIKSALSKSTWILVKKVVGQKKAPGQYYVIRGIIWRHIDRVYPKLFLGEVNLQGSSIADIPAWVVMDDSDMGPRLLSWLNPRTRQVIPVFYKEAERISARGILEILKRQKSVFANAASSKSSQASPAQSRMVNLSLFDNINPGITDLHARKNKQLVVDSAA
jgi:hypothetical protein